MFFGATIGFLVALFLVTRTFVVVPQRQRAVRERLGKFQDVMEPGFHFMVPLLDRAAYTHDVREQVIDVPPQMCNTKDNIQVEVDGILYLRVEDPKGASYGSVDFRVAAVNLAQSTMRAEIGKLSLEQTFYERDEMNEHIVREIDHASHAWGVKVLRYEIKTIAPSSQVIHTLEKQMEAERQKRAAILVSTGQKEAKIAISEGQRIEAVNLSEGEKQKRINEASGQAKEIRLLAEATAKGIAEVAAAIKAPGGNQAVRTQLTEQFIHELGRVLEGANVSVVPAQLAQLQAFFQGMGVVGDAVAQTPSQPQKR